MDMHRFLSQMTVFLMFALFLWRPATAEDISQSANQTADENRIHITADRLTTDTNEKLVEFIGNVKATQGTTILTADRLKVLPEYRMPRSVLRPVVSRGSPPNFRTLRLQR